MKLIFFLVAFCLVCVCYYFSWSGKERERRGESTANLVISSDNYYEALKYSGKFQITDDEKGFKSISPGGYVKYRKNEDRVTAESDLEGKIEYTITDGQNKFSANEEQGRKRIAQTVREMIDWGFGGDARMDRIYRNGGIRALLSEVDSMKTDQVRVQYLDKVFDIDSLSSEDLTGLAKKIGTLGTDQEKTRLLNRFSSGQLKNPLIAQAYFHVVQGIGSDMEKVNNLQHVLDIDTVRDANADTIMIIASRLGSDMDKVNLYKNLIDKGLITGPRFDSLVGLTSQIGSDMDKINLYKILMEEKTITESQWISLLNKTAQLGSDMDKSNLLVEIAQKMPRTENVKSAYLKVAKTIGNDPDYGKAMRAVE